MSVARPS
jgi:hypothetical protein